MPKVLKVILIIVLIIVVLVGLIIAGIAFLFNAMMTAQMAPDDYTSQVQTGGNSETKYLANGNFEVK